MKEVIREKALECAGGYRGSQVDELCKALLCALFAGFMKHHRVSTSV